MEATIEQPPQEYPHQVWLVWWSGAMDEGCEVHPLNVGSTPQEVLDYANKRQRFSEEEGFDFAEIRRAKVPFEELDKIEDMTPFLEPRSNKKERRR